MHAIVYARFLCYTGLYSVWWLCVTCGVGAMERNGIRRGMVIVVGMALLALVGCTPGLPAATGATRTPSATATPQATATPSLPGPADVTFKESKEIPGGIYDLITGADGAAWFTTASAVRRMTVAGAIQTFQTHGFPENLLVGPDKNVWFLERTTGSLPTRIARITSSGALSEFPLPNGERIFAPNLVAGEDGALWGLMSSYGIVNGSAFDVSAAVIRMTTSGAITRYPLPANFGPSEFGDRNIVTRAGGGAWVTAQKVRVDAEPNHVFRLTQTAAYFGFITPGGHLTQVALPSGVVTEPTLVGSDANGTLWAEVGDGKGMTVDKLSPAGVMTVAVPASTANIRGLAGNAVFDAQGGFWYTLGQGQSLHGTSIYHVTADGVAMSSAYGNGPSVQLFPSDAQTADSVVAGPENAIWFTERISDYIGRATLDGAITEFRLPLPAHVISLLGALVVGPDGNLWYVRTYYDKANSLPVSSVIGRLIL